MFLIAPSENDQQPDMALTEYKLNYLCLVYFKADPGRTDRQRIRIRTR